MTSKNLTRNDEKSLNSWAATLLRSELKARKMSYADLAERMRSASFEITEPAIRSRLSRGTLSAAFVLGALQAMRMSAQESGAFVARWQARR